MPAYSIKVKRENQEPIQPESVKVLGALAKLPEFKDVFTTTSIAPGASPDTIYNATPGQEKMNCWAGMPLSLVDKSYRPKKTAGNREDPSHRYPELAKQMHRGRISSHTLMRASKDHVSRQPTFFLDNGDGSGQFFKGSVRGDVQYARKEAQRIAAACKVMNEVPGEAIFVTFTYWNNRFGNDMFKAYKIHKRQVRKWLRKARKLGCFHYVQVLEATLQGYPHTHIIGKWRNMYHPHVYGPNKEWYLKDRNFYDKLKSWQPNQNFKVLVVNNTAIKDYISKYISKGLDAFSKPYDEMDKDEREACRKSRLCYMLGYMTHSRQFNISQNLQDPPEEEEVDEVKVDRELVDRVRDTSIISTKTADALVSLLNNLTVFCKSRVVGMFDLLSKKQFDGDIGYWDRVPPDKKEAFKAGGVPLGCPGCILTQILDEMIRARAHRTE